MPWKVLERGEPVDAPVILYWVPSSPEEMRRSPLLTSEQLTRFAGRCVAMRVVRVDDAETLAMLEAAGALPLAVLASSDGAILGRVEIDLSAHAVERMVREELDRRASAADAALDLAREKANGGDVTAAAALYQSVFDQRCLCPRQGRDAQRALRKLKSR